MGEVSLMVDHSIGGATGGGCWNCCGGVPMWGAAGGGCCGVVPISGMVGGGCWGYCGVMVGGREEDNRKDIIPPNHRSSALI